MDRFSLIAKMENAYYYDNFAEVIRIFKEKGCFSPVTKEDNIEYIRIMHIMFFSYFRLNNYYKCNYYINHIIRKIKSINDNDDLKSGLLGEYSFYKLTMFNSFDKRLKYYMYFKKICMFSEIAESSVHEKRSQYIEDIWYKKYIRTLNIMLYCVILSLFISIFSDYINVYFNDLIRRIIEVSSSIFIAWYLVNYLLYKDRKELFIRAIRFLFSRRLLRYLLI